MDSKLPISLAIFAKNNEDSIELPLKNMQDIVSEIVLVDTGSKDKTIQIAQDYGARVYEVGFTDFGKIRTLTLHLARQPWVLGLDSDEILQESELHVLPLLIVNDEVDGWGLPRRRWLDLQKTKQVELDAYPDWQYRLVRNKTYMHYKNRVHERLDGARKTQTSNLGPHIEHFQDVFKNNDRLKKRNMIYEKFYKQDLQDGVKHSIPAVAAIDKKESK